MRPLVAAALLLVLCLTALQGVADADPAPVEVGSEAPNFQLTDHLGRDVELSSFRGESAVLIAFFPQAFTRGCTLEMKCLRKERRQFEADGVQVLGISCDDGESQKRFATSLGLDFPLLSDAEHVVSKRYGVFVQSASGGHAARSVFLLDRAGRVVFLDRDYATPGELSDELRAALAKLAPDDPVATLRKGPQTAEVRSKLLLIDLVDAVLADDADALDALFHPAFGRREGETQEMGEVRRRAALGDWKRKREGLDLTDKGLLDVLDPAQIRVLDTESATPMRLRPLSKRSRELAEALTDDDLLVTVRPRLRNVGPSPLFPEELTLLVREHDGRCRILAQSVR